MIREVWCRSDRCIVSLARFVFRLGHRCLVRQIVPSFDFDATRLDSCVSVHRQFFNSSHSPVRLGKLWFREHCETITVVTRVRFAESSRETGPLMFDVGVGGSYSNSYRRGTPRVSYTELLFRPADACMDTSQCAMNVVVAQCNATVHFVSLSRSHHRTHRQAMFNRRKCPGHS